MAVRGIGNAAFMASKLVQTQGQFRLFNASAVGFEPITEKSKKIYEKAKETINNPENTTADAYHDLVHEVETQAEKVKNKMNANESGREAENSSSDPRGSQKHINKQIKENEKEFSRVDKKLGGSGKSDLKGGYDPKTQ
uniref:Mitochondrial import inner membrane translocase subunit TIM16 n=1 Tax=Panagrolaimus sp. ES5 TaxID=591445 RepID=A0AC34GWY7_9BILA